MKVRTSDEVIKSIYTLIKLTPLFHTEKEKYTIAELNLLDEKKYNYEDESCKKCFLQADLNKHIDFKLVTEKGKAFQSSGPW